MGKSLIPLFAAFAFLTAPAFAGSPAFNVSLYTCSNVYWGKAHKGDNCVADPANREAVMDAIFDDGGDNSDGDPGDGDE